MNIIRRPALAALAVAACAALAPTQAHAQPVNSEYDRAEAACQGTWVEEHPSPLLTALGYTSVGYCKTKVCVPSFDALPGGFTLVVRCVWMDGRRYIK